MGVADGPDIEFKKALINSGARRGRLEPVQANEFLMNRSQHIFLYRHGPVYKPCYPSYPDFIARR